MTTFFIVNLQLGPDGLIYQKDPKSVCEKSLLSRIAVGLR